MSAFAPNYETRKRVEAYPIASVGAKAVMVDLPNGDTRLVPVPASFSARQPPTVGDMLVRYVDGYLSHCPADVFLRDATPLGADREPAEHLTAHVPEAGSLGGWPPAQVRPASDVEPLVPRRTAGLPHGRPHP